MPCSRLCCWLHNEQVASVPLPLPPVGKALIAMTVGLAATCVTTVFVPRMVAADATLVIDSAATAAATASLMAVVGMVLSRRSVDEARPSSAGPVAARRHPCGGLDHP